MPELPEIEASLGALRPRVEGHVPERVRGEPISLVKAIKGDYPRRIEDQEG